MVQLDGNAMPQQLALYSGALRTLEWVQCRCNRVEAFMGMLS
jgi:hypothetical protein